jgi:nicotinamide mononucleotide transporter
MDINLIDWIRSNYIEFCAALFSIAGVWLTTKQIIWCWPVSLAGLLMYSYIFFFSHIYLQAILQVFYLAMTLYGWYNWIHGGEYSTELKISGIKKKQSIIYFLIWLIFSLIFGYLFSRYTHDPLPWLDSLTTVCGIITTYLMAKKILENWIIWIFNDIVVVTICFYQKLYISSVLYIIFIILAIYGFSEWRKELQKIKS